MNYLRRQLVFDYTPRILGVTRRKRPVSGFHQGPELPLLAEVVYKQKPRRLETRLKFLARFAQLAKVLRVLTQSRSIVPIEVVAGCDWRIGPEYTGVQRRRIISTPHAG
jgi:hypothetical protein